MTKKVAYFVADGTEPVEAIAPVDILRRGNVEVTLVSGMPESEVAMAHGVYVNADTISTAVNLDGYDMIVVPGGTVGVANLGKCNELAQGLKSFMAAGKHVASICAGPTILADLGLLDGRKATCYPGCEGGFPEGVYQDVIGVVVDGNLITASGPGLALDFGLALLRALEGDKVADDVKSGMLIQ